jgi:hypothetical protein
MRSVTRSIRIDRSAVRIAALLAGALPSAAAAQAEPGTRLDVRVHVESVTVNGDQVGIEYRLRNAAGSIEDLFTFTVDAPAPPLLVEQPAPADSWATATLFRNRPVARWAALEPVVPPGAESPPLRTRAAGLPAIVRYWVQGYAPPASTAADTPVHVPAADPLTTRSRTGLTVGVEPLDTNAEAVLSRL